MYLWKKCVAPARLDHWLERVGQVVAAERIVVVTPAASPLQRLEIYVDTEGDARELARRFGGKVRPVDPSGWLSSPATALGKPLAFGKALLVTGHPGELASLRALHPGRHVLCIPAAMAFGTGEHATTAMCLRFLGEVRVPLTRRGPWKLLDLGSGSGVLALAGKLFGAVEVHGFDNDKHAVRIARENAALNGVAGVRFRRVDLLRQPWPEPSARGWSVVTANLFSDLLIALLPQVVAVVLRGGHLIASGILATQADEVDAALRAQGLTVVTKRRRGRWVAYLARR